MFLNKKVKQVKDKVKLTFEGYIPVLASCEIEIDCESPKSVDIQAIASNKKIIQSLNWQVLLDEYAPETKKYSLIYKSLKDCSSEDLMEIIENIDVDIAEEQNNENK